MYHAWWLDHGSSAPLIGLHTHHINQCNYTAVNQHHSHVILPCYMCSCLYIFWCILQYLHIEIGVVSIKQQVVYLDKQIYNQHYSYSYINIYKLLYFWIYVCQFWTDMYTARICHALWVLSTKGHVLRHNFVIFFRDCVFGTSIC